MSKLRREVLLSAVAATVLAAPGSAQGFLRPRSGCLDSASTQAAWRVYIQVECAWEASAYQVGTLEAMVQSSCLEAAT